MPEQQQGIILRPLLEDDAWNKEGYSPASACHVGGDQAALVSAVPDLALDDKMGYGTRGDVNRWWLDLETQKKDGQSFHSDNANARDLSLDRDTSMGNDKVATYPVDKLPRADQEGTGAGRPKAGTERHQGCGRGARRSERTPGHGEGQSARLTAHPAKCFDDP